MRTNMDNRGEAVVYQSEDGALRIDAKVASETLWLPTAKIAELFGVNVPAISKPIKTVYATGELDSATTVSKIETARQEGKEILIRLIMNMLAGGAT